MKNVDFLSEKEKNDILKDFSEYHTETDILISLNKNQLIKLILSLY